MTKLSIKTAMAALLAGSLAATAGMPAFARADGGSVDPAKFQERIEKRVDKALNGTDATQDQKKQIVGILQAAFADMKPLHAKRAENRAVQRRRADPLRKAGTHREPDHPRQVEHVKNHGRCQPELRCEQIAQRRAIEP